MTHGLAGVDSGSVSCPVYRHRTNDGDMANSEPLREPPGMIFAGTGIKTSQLDPSFRIMLENTPEPTRNSPGQAEKSIC